MRHAPRVYLSALNGRGVHRLFPAMRAVDRAYTLRVSAADLNRVLREAWDRRPPPSSSAKAPRLFYGSQVRQRPPHFALFTNLQSTPHFSYMRSLENVLREAFGLDGVPIRVMIKGRKG